MNSDQRDAVRANANYLRNVRPIDPEEIHEYVEGQPHPAAVRQVLREDAFALGLVEREDGTFEPVPPDPVESLTGPITEFPPQYATLLEDMLVDRYGPEWYAGDTGDHLRSVIRRLKSKYYRRETVEYDIDVALGYAVYHLPDYYAAIQYVLDDLTERHLLDRQLRVIDVGAGAGGPALGLLDYLPGDALVDYHAVEPSAAADVIDAMLSDPPRNVHATIHRMTAEAFAPPDCDLVIFANVVSELEHPVATIDQYTDALHPDGSVVILAPADKETSKGLREVERAIGDGLTVYSPTIRLWPGFEPTDHCWSFDVAPDIEVPRFQHQLDEAGNGSGEFVNVDVQFSYSILRRDQKRRIDFSPANDRVAKLANTPHHVTERINAVAVKLSHDLGDGDNQVYLIGDGSQRIDHYAVLTRPTALNRSLNAADYGDCLRFERTLVLWNEDEDAYNLVVDDETVVDRIAP